MPLNKTKGSTFDSSDNIVVGTLAQLKALDKESYEGTIIVGGHTAVGDGGGGVWYYDPTVDRTLDDNGTIIDPTETGVGLGCWIRVYSDNAGTLEWFGSDDTLTANLVEAVGVPGLKVIVHEPLVGGLFRFDPVEVVNHDGIDNFNGWVRINDANFYTPIQMRGNKVLASGDADLTQTVPGTYDNPQELPVLHQVSTLLANALTATPVTRTIVEGVLTYDFEVDLSTASIYISGNSDRGRLKSPEDYIIASGTPNELTLTQSFAAGSKITAYLFDSSVAPSNPGINTKAIDTETYTFSNDDIDQTLKFTYAGVLSGDGIEVTIPNGLLSQFACLINCDSIHPIVFMPAGNMPKEISNNNGIIENSGTGGGWAALLGDDAGSPDTYNLTGDTRLVP